MIAITFNNLVLHGVHCADLLDELPEKRRIEERGYLSDDGEEVFTIHLVEIFLHAIIIRIIILLDETKVE